MATRTAKGTAKLKASGTTLTLASVSANAGDALIVCVGCQQQNAPASVTWGSRELTRSAFVPNSTSGHASGIWIARSLVNTATRDIVATWASAIGARALFAFTLSEGHIRDQFATATQTASTAPSAGPTSVLGEFNDFAIGILCAEGPSSDTAPTASGWTAGQSDGTLGAPPISNITIHEFYKQISGDDSAVTLSGTGATARDWANCVVAYREIAGLAPFDSSGAELLVGDTVDFEGSESTISSFTTEQGIPAIVCVLADGRQVFSYYCALVK